MSDFRCISYDISGGSTHVSTIRPSVPCQSECCVLIGLALRKRPVLGVCFIPKMDEFHGDRKNRDVMSHAAKGPAGYQWAKGHPDIPKMHHDTQLIQYI